MMKLPDFGPQTDGKSSICLEGGQYHAYVDLDGAIGLLYDLHWLAREQILGEEVSISSNELIDLPKQGKPIGYCEFNLTPSYAQKKHGKNILKVGQSIRHKPHGVYSPEGD